MAKGKYQEWLTEDSLLRIESWARDGLTDEQISRNIGVSYSTFRDWMKKFPAVLAALKKGKAPIDAEVDNALLKKALGFEYEETEVVTEVVGSETKTRMKKIKRYSVPDTTAIIFWVKNRKPEVWRKASPVFEAKMVAETEKLQAENERLRFEIERLREGEGVTVTENKIAEFFEKLGEEIDDS